MTVQSTGLVVIVCSWKVSIFFHDILKASCVQICRRLRGFKECESHGWFRILNAMP